MDSRTGNAEEARRVVTVVFTDVVGSTELGDQLDPESVRQIMSLYFHKMKTILEAYGGTVEKFIGDAIMAVFGVPERHEDDALRAVRAVAEMRSFLPTLNDELERSWGVSIAFRTGVNTGEVVSGDPATGQTLVTGDAVNKASRLEHAARAGEILLGEDTWRLVRDGVIAEPSDPLSLKGKSTPVPVRRLLEVITDAPGLARRIQSPLVGRQDELAFLMEEFERVVVDRTSRVVTVLGEAGLGKSRLVNEFMDVAADGARVLRGRCLSYGRGITFWPVAEIVRQCAEIDDRDPVDEARAKLDAVLSSEADAAIVSERVAAAIGLSAGSSALQETFWAVRRLLEIVAADRPTVAIFDDIQWGEPAFLDLLEYVEGFLKGVPVLVLCMARPDLLEARPSWGARVEGLLKLERLSADESARLIGNLLGKAELPQGLEGRIAESSQGNPLFVEEMLRTLVDDELLRKEDGAWVLVGDPMSVPTPASVNALLDSGLDRLEDEERKLIERASVIGQVFWWGAVAVLTPEESRPGLAGRLQGLVRKELIRPDVSTIADEDAFGFSHELVREAAYGSLTRRSKAEMHERFGTWLEQKVGDHIEEFEEILGYHLEQACRYRDELGRVNPSNELALRAAAHLAAAGRSALERSDTQAAIQLLTRSLDLLPDDGADRLEALLVLAEAYEGAGDFREARSAVDEVIARANDEESGFSVRGRLQLIGLRFRTEPAYRASDAGLELEELIHSLDASDGRSLGWAWRRLSSCQWIMGRATESEESLERAGQYATQARDAGLKRSCQQHLTTILLFGPGPAAAVRERTRAILENPVVDRITESYALDVLAMDEAWMGRFDEARHYASRAIDILQDLGLRFHAALEAEVSGVIEALAGDEKASERVFRGSVEALMEMGDTGGLSSVAALLAQSLHNQGRFSEAEHFAQLSRDNSQDDDIDPQVRWRSVSAQILAQQGHGEEAETLAREAVVLAEAAEFPILQADALMALASVLTAVGRSEQAAGFVDQALVLYEEKGDHVSASRARGLREQLVSTR